MPDEYISREAALTALQDSDLFNTTERQLRAIRELPAADVAEVHHAHWEEADWREYDAQIPKAAIVCSDCRNAFKKGTLRIQSFCQACGARMDGAAE